MVIYEKINKIKEGILKANLKKSGFNKFSNFSYYELADITPTIIKLCNEFNVMTQFTFEREYAKLIIIDAENPDDRLIYLSPMEELEIKGANKIQALGGTETYQRRYLYMMAFDIIESDMFDATAGRTDEDRAKEFRFPATSKKVPNKSILEVYESDPKYLQWCLDNGKSEEVKGFIELLTDLRRTEIPTDEEQQELFDYLNRFNLMSDEERNEIYKKYNVNSNKELTLKELREIFR